jgi:hypothetical protein
MIGVDEVTVQVRDRVTPVLEPQEGSPPPANVPDRLPASHVMFACEDPEQAYALLGDRGVSFPQTPAGQPFDWRAMFEDNEGTSWPSPSGIRSARRRPIGATQSEEERCRTPT